jgi:hypothetical protein
MAATTGTYLVGAHASADTSFVAWVAALGAATDDLVLGVGERSYPVTDRWTTFSAASGDVRVQRIAVDGLGPGRRHEIRLARRGEVVAVAEAATLPQALPSSREGPFTMLVGSCFSVLQDPAGLVGAAVARLPAFARPHVTILSGDQVYLDSPALHFLGHTHSREDLADELARRYALTWTQSSTLGGFRRVLSAASTFFSSDDHELWNNAPNRTPYVRDSWTDRGRAAWIDAATALFTMFQAARPGETFRVPPLSCFVSDTRLERTRDGTAVMAAAQWDALVTWVRALEGPGLLVTGQPIFVRSTGWRGRFFDRGLADYRGYGDLVRLIAATPHDLVVLTGDVHFGRIATCVLPSGRRVVEVISSPLALVHSAAAGKWVEAPQRFPAAALPGVAQAAVSTSAYRRVDEHFLTLAFTVDGRSVRMDVTAWPVRAGGPPAGEPVATTVLN